MAYCSNCGSEIGKNEKFCSVCGTKVISEEVKPLQKEVAEPVQTPPENMKKGKYTKEGKKIIDSGPRPDGYAQNIKSQKVKKKKKGGCLRFFLRTVLILFILMIIGVVIIWNLPDDENTISNENLNETTISQQNSVKMKVVDKKPVSNKKSTVSAENPVAVLGEVKLDFGAFNIDKEKKVSVKRLPENIIDNECKIVTYDISLEGTKKLNDYMKITLPFDKSFIKNGTIENCVVAQHFNEKTNEWEPVIFDIDKENKKVIIETDHLSKYGIFTIKNKKKRRAYVSDFYIPERYYDDVKDEHLAVIKEFYSPKRSVGEKAVSAGLNFWGTFSGQSGAAINLITLGGKVSTKLIDGMNDGFKRMGYIFSALQLTYDLHRGDQKSAAINLTKNLMNQMVAEINSTSLNLAFVGVYFIDYSLTKFGNAAMAERYESLFKVYDYYNENHNPHYRTNKEWRAYFIELERKYPDKPKLVSDLIMKEIDAYSSSFIKKMGLGTNHENTLEFNALAGDVGFKHIAWPNSGDILKIQGEGKQRLIDKLYPVFASLNHYRINKMKEALNKEIRQQQKIMNTVVPLNITEDLDEDEEADFANYKVCLRPLNDDADKKQWTGRLNDRGYLKTSFTIIGFILAGEPNRVEIYDPEDDPDEDEPVFVKKFIANPDGVTILLQNNKLVNGPWEVTYLDGKSIYDVFETKSFEHSLQTATVEVLVETKAADWKEGAKEKVDQEQNKLDKKDKKEWLKGVDQLNQDYNRTLSSGAISAPSGKYEKTEKVLYMNKFKPVKRGSLYIFNMPSEDDEKGDETRVILDLKTNEYFEAKVFFKSKGFISIDYLKGKLKK